MSSLKSFASSLLLIAMVAEAKPDNQSIGQLQQQIDNLEAIVALLDTNLSARIDAWEDCCTDNADAIDALTLRVAQNENDISDNDADISSLGTRVTQNETDIGTNDDDISALDTRVT